MPAGPTAPFLTVLRDSALLSADQQKQLGSDLHRRYPEPRALARHLIERGWLTPFQVNLLFQGRAADLVLGSYVVLERLGEGGTGQVFKARHQKLGRTVAIKVIRPELLADPEVIQRFYREVHVLSQMSHPNVVHAYDADTVGGTHFLVMEYVEGTDLAGLVKQRGPLPMSEACDYIRQAACGLAHAHEKGLVHRDIKPSNLLVTRAQGAGMRVVKILDLGLARLGRSLNGDITTTLTTLGSGAVTMGTPDYLAPEQALDFHAVDIRADIYSLGCTLFFLLTGQPPFAGGTMAQKLLKHQQADPPPVERFRPDVSPELEAGLRRMMAKRPADRFQTPAEIAQWLSSLDAKGGSAAGDMMRRRRWLLLAGAGGGLGLGLGGLVLTTLIGSSRTERDTGSSPGTGLAATTRPTERPGADRAVVLQGRSAVRDVLISALHPATKLGLAPRDNPISKRDECDAFLVRFDVAKLDLRPKVRIEKALVSFFVWDPSSTGNTKVCSFLLKTGFNEANATWQQAAEGRAWQGGKTFKFGVDTGGPSPGFVIVKPDAPGTDTVDPPLEYQLDVTAMVQLWVDGTVPNCGLAIAPVIDRAIDEGHQTRFQVYASEYSRPQYTPKLTIRLPP